MTADARSRAAASPAWGLRSLAAGAKAAASFAVGWARWSYDQFVLLPAARFLPRRLAMALANAAGWAEVMLPIESSRVARAEVSACGVRGGRAVRRAAARRLATLHWNLVLLKRFRTGREHPRDWAITHVGAEQALSWLDEVRPFILASGHFIEAATQVRTAFLPLDNASLAFATPGRSWSPQLMRRRQERLLADGLRNFLMGRPEDADGVPPAEHGNSLEAMVRTLQRPGTVQSIFFDAVWEKPSGFVRPFAGLGERRFALGVARLSRLAQAPIAHYVPIITGPGEIRLEWGPYIEPPAADAAVEAEIAVVNELADALELAVARHHDQYNHPIGWDRQWSAERGRWEPPAGSPAPVPESPGPAGSRLLNPVSSLKAEDSADGS